MGEVIPKVSEIAAASVTGAPAGGDSLSDPLESAAFQYNTGWIDQLGIAAVRDDIDMGYSRKKALQRVPRVAEVDAEIAAATKKFGPKNTKVKDLRARRAEVVAGVTEEELNAVKAGPTGKLEDAESIDDRIFTEELSAKEGRDIVRQNLMGEMVGLLGTPEKVETWFKAIRPASVPGNPLMYGKAASRLERAKAKFESKTGVGFLASSTAFAMRGRQNTRQGKGMLSHATGLAIDYKAYENPHLKDWQKRVMLETVTGGPTRLVFNGDDGKELKYNQRRDIIKQLGKETEAGTEHTAKGQTFMNEKVDEAFDAHVGTEIDFRKSLDVGGDGADDDVQKLRGLAERYWVQSASVGAASKTAGTKKKALDEVRKNAVGRIKASRLAQFDKQLADAKAAAQSAAAAEGKKLTGKQISETEQVKRIAEERTAYRKSGPDSTTIEADSAVTAARATYDEAVAKLNALRQPFLAELSEIIQPWIAKFDARISANREAVAAGAGQPDGKLVGELLKAVQSALKGRNPTRAIDALRAKPKYAPLLAGISEAVLADPRALRDHLEATATRIKSVASAKESLVALVQVRNRMLTDPQFVLGKGTVDAKTGQVAAKRTVADPSALQFLEMGLVFDGPKGAAVQEGAARAPGGASADAAPPEAHDPELAKHDYFREFTRVMIEHGFEAAGAWETADTMHFELVEGMDELQASGANRSFGPQGAREEKKSK